MRELHQDNLYNASVIRHHDYIRECPLARLVYFRLACASMGDKVNLRLVHWEGLLGVDEKQIPHYFQIFPH